MIQFVEKSNASIGWFMLNNFKLIAIYLNFKILLYTRFTNPILKGFYYGSKYFKQYSIPRELHWNFQAIDCECKILAALV
ncbi:unnamed protein product [Blepharisma stoltei]|uniref:Uncharacterized protein n=1 Tax=Blepharisma stoltei TaxID=1481888 RepID=A0AAU9KEH7_9CILI|nr:unnamed protein product [Blepharisma stoltei]